MNWISCDSLLPAEGEVVETIIMDEKGARNEQKLQRNKNLWFVPEGDMYVYYTPTHWRNSE